MKVTSQFIPRLRFSPALLLRILRVAYGMLFLFSGTLKLTDTPAFSAALDGFMIVPPGMLPFVAVAIPLLEVGLGVGLVTGIKPGLVCSFATALLAVFTGVVAEKLLEGAKVSCGCFGSLSTHLVSGTTLVRNAILIVWGILLTVLSSTRARELPGIENSVKSKKSLNVFEASVMLETRSAYQGYGRSAVTITAAVALLALMSLLVVQNHELKNRLALMVDSRALSVGDTFHDFPAWDLAGNHVDIQYPQHDSLVTLLFIFSTDCKPCADNLPQWVTIAKALEGFKQCRILGVSLDSLEPTRQFVEKNGLSFAPVVPAVPQFSRRYKISGTPQTIVLDGYGHVMGVWAGVLDSLKNDEMLKVIHSSRQAAAT